MVDDDGSIEDQGDKLKIELVIGRARRIEAAVDQFVCF
jgi:hypothetical protein